MNDLKLDGLTGKTIKEAEVDGFGIRIVFTDGAVFDYDASDGGYSQYELTEATAEAMQKQIDHVAESDKKVSVSCGQENDLISRQTAIDAIVNTVSKIELHDNSDEVARYGATFRQHEIIDIIEGMPSAQPETATVTIGRTRGSVAMWYECDTCGEPIDQKDCYCRKCGRKLTLPKPYRGGDE